MFSIIFYIILILIALLVVFIVRQYRLQRAIARRRAERAESMQRQSTSEVPDA